MRASQSKVFSNGSSVLFEIGICLPSLSPLRIYVGTSVNMIDPLKIIWRFSLACFGMFSLHFSFESSTITYRSEHILIMPIGWFCLLPQFVYIALQTGLIFCLFTECVLSHCFSILRILTLTFGCLMVSPSYRKLFLVVLTFFFSEIFQESCLLVGILYFA